MEGLRLPLSRVTILSAAFFIQMAWAAPPPPLPLPGAVLPDDPLPTPGDFAPPPGPLIAPPEVPQQRAPVGGVKVEVSRFELVGVVDRPEQGIMIAEAEELLAEFLRNRDEQGTGLTLFDLQDAAELVTNYYRERGQFVSRAYLPPQDVENGVIKIAVTEAKLGKVLVELPEGSNYRPDVFTRLFDRQVGQPVTKDAVESGLLTASDLPGIDAFGVFTPGEQSGETDLNLKIPSEKRWEGRASADNHGNETSGEFQARLDFQFNNPSGAGDRISVTMFSALEEKNLYGGVGYELPILDGRTSVGARYSVSDYEAGGQFADFGVTGDSRIATVFVQHDIERQRLSSLSTYVAMNLKEANAESLAIETTDRLFVMEAALFGEIYDEFRGVNQFSAGIDVGVEGVLGSELSGTPNVSRLGPEGEVATADFYKVKGSYSRFQVFGNGITGLFRFEGQWSPDLLTSLEQIVFGGASNVRGYPRADALMDKGAFTSAEIFVEAPGFSTQSAFSDYVWGDILTVSAFFDAGYGSLNKPLNSDEADATLMGAGIALNLEVPDGFGGRLQYAKPIGPREATNGDNYQVFGEIYYRF